MAKEVEEILKALLAEAKGGSPEVEGAKELKLLKDKNVSRRHVSFSFSLSLFFFFSPIVAPTRTSSLLVCFGAKILPLHLLLLVLQRLLLDVWS